MLVFFYITSPWHHGAWVDPMKEDPCSRVKSQEHGRIHKMLDCGWHDLLKFFMLADVAEEWVHMLEGLQMQHLCWHPFRRRGTAMLCALQARCPITMV